MGALSIAAFSAFINQPEYFIRERLYNIDIANWNIDERICEVPLPFFRLGVQLLNCLD